MRVLNHVIILFFYSQWVTTFIKIRKFFELPHSFKEGNEYRVVTICCVISKISTIKDDLKRNPKSANFKNIVKTKPFYKHKQIQITIKREAKTHTISHELPMTINRMVFTQ